jgi:hypothetical protein
MATEYRSFRDFYPDYLAEYRNSVSRRLHPFAIRSTVWRGIS